MEREKNKYKSLNTRDKKARKEEKGNDLLAMFTVNRTRIKVNNAAKKFKLDIQKIY